MARVVWAQVQGPTTQLAQDLNLAAPTSDFRGTIVRVVQWALGFLGLLATLVMLYGGYLWMTSRGDVKQIEQAKKVLRNGLIGLLIILSAWAIVAAVVRFLGIGLNGNPGGGNRPPGTCINCFALGGGIIEDHYPERNQRDVPRNVRVLITFREAIQIDGTKPDTTFLLNPTNPTPGVTCGDINPAVFELQWTDAAPTPVVHTGQVCTTNEKQFVIATTIPLGSPDVGAHYKASIFGRSLASPNKGLTKKDGNAANLGTGGLYFWEFDVSTRLDTTPPQIVNVQPPDTDIVPRNKSVKITFDEPINPLSATGLTSTGFNNISVVNTATSLPVDGQFYLGNGYRTVYFVTNEACGTNSCGQTMYCLPPNADLRVEVKAATLWNNPSCGLGPDPLNNVAAACSPSNGKIYDGVVDVSGNSLDGERNENPPGVLKLPSGDQPPLAEGQPVDNFVWNFSTNDTVVTSGPQILQEVTPGTPGVYPTPDSNGIPVDAPLTAQFNRSMLPLVAFPNPADPSAEPYPPVKVGVQTSANANANFSPADIFAPVWVRSTPVYACSLTNTACATSADCSANPLDFCGQERVAIHHGTMVESEDYEVRIGSGIQDDTQNCFLPSIGPVAPAAPNASYSPQPNPSVPGSWTTQPY